MSEYENIAQRYIDSWNEQDADKRRALLAEVFTPEATYTDPLAQVAGVEAIDQVIAGAQAQFAGLGFSLGPVDGHNDIARFTWLLGAPGGEPLVIGFDVIVLEGGRVKQVLGFLDKVPG
ncbi:nuclear transport factor 2 family protein [Nocardia pseudobrasiliensis]|uniref:Ketosteroid isomerase-like protein n=1 Tax=Nocardia pseudobrasiliensis TaxID=45979 RepID=A0A370I8R0_9NOCA|nr:nuclear transport factor 2 family protein [Nocardia pseudobrasiliensis]RDI67127.1 ketosteroid isomerase-like protein [Nocardia pseudobrasiliensis]